MIVYLWILLTIPSDRLVCELWTRAIPTQTELVQACGVDALNEYRLDVTQNGIGICSIPAASLPWVREDCNLSGDLDQYRMRIVEPKYQTALGCANIETFTADPPSDSVIRAQCPTARNYVVKLWASHPYTPTADPVPCKPPPVPQPATIATSKDLHLLAGKMIWYGLARSNCPNQFSGVDPITFAATACGMDGARASVITWQNSLDASILKASAEWHVPPQTLKNIIERETQYWAWTGSQEEHGMIQITDAGAHVVLHVYEKGYYQLTEEQRASARAAWLASLDCNYCSPQQAIDKANENMGKYAQALAAYYCMYGNWDAALTAWNVKYKEN
jgi:hypothetical protein